MVRDDVLDAARAVARVLQVAHRRRVDLLDDAERAWAQKPLFPLLEVRVGAAGPPVLVARQIVDGEDRVDVLGDRVRDEHLRAGDAPLELLRSMQIRPLTVRDVEDKALRLHAQKAPAHVNELAFAADQERVVDAAASGRRSEGPHRPEEVRLLAVVDHRRDRLAAVRDVGAEREVRSRAVHLFDAHIVNGVRQHSVRRKIER